MSLVLLLLSKRKLRPISVCRGPIGSVKRQHIAPASMASPAHRSDCGGARECRGRRCRALLVYRNPYKKPSVRSANKSTLATPSKELPVMTYTEDTAADPSSYHLQHDTTCPSARRFQLIVAAERSTCHWLSGFTALLFLRLE